MKTYLILFALLVPFAASAQKMDKPRIDKFTNDTIFFTTTEKIASNKSSMSDSAEIMEAYFSNSKGVLSLVLKVELSAYDHHFFRVSTGNTVLFKLGDNSLINLTNVTDVKAERRAVGTSLFVAGRDCWTADVICSITSNDIKKISAANVTAIRVQADGLNFDFDIKAKDGKVVKKMGELIVAAR